MQGVGIAVNMDPSKLRMNKCILTSHSFSYRALEMPLHLKFEEMSKYAKGP